MLFVCNPLVYSLLPEGNDELQKNCWQEGHNACCILIRCSQMIGYQVYTEGSKPQRNTLL